MAQSQISHESYIWTEGMTDWKVMTEVSEFNLPRTPSGEGVDPSVVQNEPSFKFSPAESEASEASSIVEQVVITPMEVSSVNIQTEAPAADFNELQRSEEEGIEEKKPKNHARMIIWAALLVIAAGGAAGYQKGYLTPVLESPVVSEGLEKLANASRPYLLTISDQLPFLAQWVSPISSLSDVSPGEFEELKQAAREKVVTAGPRFAIALSKADVFSPSFYIASNLPDGTQFQVYVIGKPDTLLNQMSFDTKTTAVLNGKIGKTEAIHFMDGKPVPRGEYFVYVTLQESQLPEIKSAIASLPLAAPSMSPEIPKSARVAIQKSYFLSGNKDAIYLSRLKEFHDKLNEKAHGEINEIRQFTATLDSQLNSTTTKFSLLKKGKMTPKQKKQWESFHAEWIKLENQLDQIFMKWTPEAMQKDYFHRSLYSLTQQVGQSVAKVHDFHNAFFTGVHDSKTFEIQLGEAISSAQGTMTLLKAKIEQTEKLPPTPNGMPQRESL
jgi:hypothetical protein